jgi:GNAT superfamily N-acetyltransferase
VDINALNKANIDNLTGLWEKMGVQQPHLFDVEGLSASVSWPHRYWFGWDKDLGKSPEFEKAIAKLSQMAIIPVWHRSRDTADFLENSLQENGYGVSFEQTAMYLEPARYRPATVRTKQVEQIRSAQEVETWTTVASESFGYTIDPVVIQKVASDPDIQLLQMFSEGQVAATAMLYRTADVIGVHQLGVAKKHQGKGLATAFMQHIISAGPELDSRYIVLQASTEAKSLYLRLGFIQQFTIRNYQLIK